jgi:hypothetical protein
MNLLNTCAKKGRESLLCNSICKNLETNKMKVKDGDA